jgi:hypothetical protein
LRHESVQNRLGADQRPLAIGFQCCNSSGHKPLPLAQPKAANLARMRAESLNGGLSQYRAASCMYETGAGSCLESISDGGFLFRFQGGPPGWQQQTPPNPTIETSVLVSRDGDRILEVTYNGTVR